MVDYVPHKHIGVREINGNPANYIDEYVTKNRLLNTLRGEALLSPSRWDQIDSQT